jgi:hypothetical protein
MQRTDALSDTYASPAPHVPSRPDAASDPLAYFPIAFFAKPRRHAWVIEAVDCGQLGSAEHWVCQRCGASGGPVVASREYPSWPPFIAGRGTRTPLSQDCAEAARQISAAREG